MGTFRICLHANDGNAACGERGRFKKCTGKKTQQEQTEVTEIAEEGTEPLGLEACETLRGFANAKAVRKWAMEKYFLACFPVCSRVSACGLPVKSAERRIQNGFGTRVPKIPA